MKKMKKWNGIVLAGIMALSLIGCANSNNETPAETSTADKTETLATSEKTMTIGLIPQSTLFVFYDYVQKGATDAASEAGYTINYQGTTTDTDGTGQRKIVEDMLVTGIDALAISATNADAVSDLLQSLDIPVIAWDCGLDSSVVTTSVSVDHYKASSAVAEYMIQNCPDGGKFAVISTNAGNAVIQQREKGFMDTLTKKKALNVSVRSIQMET